MACSLPWVIIAMGVKIRLCQIECAQHSNMSIDGFHGIFTIETRGQECMSRGMDINQSAGSTYGDVMPSVCLMKRCSISNKPSSCMHVCQLHSTTASWLILYKAIAMLQGIPTPPTHIHMLRSHTESLTVNYGTVDLYTTAAMTNEVWMLFNFLNEA